MKLPPPNCNVGKECMELSRAYSGEALQKQIAERVATKWLSLYKPLFFSKIRMPAILEQFNKLKTHKEREEFTKRNPRWEEKDEVRKFFEEEHNITRQNASNKSFLEQMLGYCTKGEKNHTEIASLLAQFIHVKV